MAFEQSGRTGPGTDTNRARTVGDGVVRSTGNSRARRSAGGSRSPSSRSSVCAGSVRWAGTAVTGRARTRGRCWSRRALYDSDSYADDLPYFVRVGDAEHLVIPYTMTYNDTKLVTPEGFGASSVLAAECCRAIDEFLREAANGRPKMMTIGLHSRIAGQPSRAGAVREIIEYALERNVWIARRADIARWWLAARPGQPPVD